MGHHAQLGLGITKRVHYKKKGAKNRSGKLRWKRKQELQADCLPRLGPRRRQARPARARRRRGGGHRDRAIGDDTLQKKAGLKVAIAGSSATAPPAVRYFKKGFRRGELRDCLRELRLALH